MATRAMTTKTVVRYRSPPKVRSHARAKFTVPLAVVAGFVPLVMDVKEAVGAKGYLAGTGQAISANITGYFPDQKKWHPEYAATHFWAPVLAGALVHKLAGRLGINRALGRAGIPILRL